jgi:hypothetical protein
MIVRFTRKYNRTVADIFGNKFQEKVKMELQSATQRIAYYCKHNHTWQNRTGALEESINFTPPERKGSMWTSTVFAGGWARIKYVFDYAKRKATGKKRRSYRYQRGERVKLQRGMGRFVNYAYWVEKKGYPVLKQGIEKYRKQLTRIFANNLKIDKIGLGR